MLLTIEQIAGREGHRLLTSNGYDFMSYYYRMGSGRSIIHSMAESALGELPDEFYNRYYSKHAMTVVAYLMEKRGLTTNGPCRRRALNMVNSSATDTDIALVLLMGLAEGDAIILAATFLPILDRGINHEEFSTAFVAAIKQGWLGSGQVGLIIRNCSGLVIKAIMDKIYEMSGDIRVKGCTENLAGRTDFTELCTISTQKIAAALSGVPNEQR